MLRSIVFWASMLLLKLYVFRSLFTLSNSKRYRWFVIGLFIFSLSSIGLGAYSLFNVFFNGVIHPPFWANFMLSANVMFIICELVLAPIFLFDDLLFGFYYLYRRFAKDKAKVTRKDRRRFVKKVGATIMLLPFIQFLHGITRGKYAYSIENKVLSFENLPESFDGFKILHFSDFHAGSFDFFEPVKQGLATIKELDYDLLVFTGDLVNNHAEEFTPFIDAFSDLSAPFGKFSVLGNHDYPMRKRMFRDQEHQDKNLKNIKELHGQTGFSLLLNEHKVIKKEGQRLVIAGVENWGKSHYFPKAGDLDKALDQTRSDDFIVLLSHDPTHWEEKVRYHKKVVDLTLSGHTHGLQMGVKLPGFQWSPIQYSYKHWAGAYRENDRSLYVNRGFGFFGFAGRVGMYPEITILELKKA